jgi:hypothetical protein
MMSLRWFVSLWHLCGSSIVTGLLTETDYDVGQLAVRHEWPAGIITDVLQLMQKVVGRSKHEEEPFALNYKALRARVDMVIGLTGSVGTGKTKPTAASVRGCLRRRVASHAVQAFTFPRDDAAAASCLVQRRRRHVDVCSDECLPCATRLSVLYSWRRRFVVRSSFDSSYRRRRAMHSSSRCTWRSTRLRCAGKGVSTALVCHNVS